MAGNEPKSKWKCNEDGALNIQNFCSEFNIKSIDTYVSIGQNI